MKGRRGARVVVWVLLGAAIALHAVLLTNVLASVLSQDPQSDPHGYIMIFGILLNLVLAPFTIALVAAVIWLRPRRAYRVSR